MQTLCGPFFATEPQLLSTVQQKIFRQRKISSKTTVRQFVRNLFSSNVGLLVLGRFLQTESGSIFGKVRVRVLTGQGQVHTNMCEPKVCSANRKLIFGFIFGSASSDGEATGDFQEDFGGNPVALESQSDKVVLARKNVFFFFFTLACFARQCGAGLIINEAAAELFYTRESRKRRVNGKGIKEKEDYLYVDDS